MYLTHNQLDKIAKAIRARVDYNNVFSVPNDVASKEEVAQTILDIYHLKAEQDVTLSNELYIGESKVSDVITESKRIVRRAERERQEMEKKALSEVKDIVKESTQEGKTRDEVLQEVGEKFPGSAVFTHQKEVPLKSKIINNYVDMIKKEASGIEGVIEDLSMTEDEAQIINQLQAVLGEADAGLINELTSLSNTHNDIIPDDLGVKNLFSKRDKALAELLSALRKLVGTHGVSKDEAVHGDAEMESEAYKLGTLLLDNPEKAVAFQTTLLFTANVMLAGYGVGKVLKYSVKGAQKILKKGKYKPLTPLQHPHEVAKKVGEIKPLSIKKPSEEFFQSAEKGEYK